MAHGRHSATDPVAALADWLAARGTAPGPVFTSMRPGGPALRPISGSAVARTLRERAGAAGLPIAGQRALMTSKLRYFIKQLSARWAGGAARPAAVGMRVSAWSDRS